MARTKDEELAKTRKREILEAAGRCFVRSGLHKASMRQICAEANLSSGAVYNYFQSKDAIIEGMAAAEQEDIAELAAYLQGERNALKAVVTAAKVIVEDTSVHDARLYAELATEASRNEAIRSRLAENDAALQACLLDTIRRGQANKTISKRQSAEDLLTLVSVVYEGFISRMASGSQADRQKMVKLTGLTVEKLLAP